MTTPLSPGAKTTAPLSWRRFGAVLAFSLLAGCTVGLQGDGGPERDAGAAEDGCFQNTDGRCVVATEGCSPETIAGGAGERCATCVEGGESFDICGAPTVGTCFQVEDPEPCTRCLTESGETVYSDCLDEGTTAVLGCEDAFYEPSADAPDGLLCEVCRDGTGRVVRETCGTSSPPDECHEENLNGRTCQVCTLDSQQVSVNCGPPVLSEPPRVCEYYEGALGSCIDCYGQNDQLLLHECSFGVGAADVAFCETVTEPSGLTCNRCFNQDSFLVSESCENDPSSRPERCQELFYEFPDEQVSCFVCVDEQNVFTVADCRSSVCDGQPAPGNNSDMCAPQACFNTYESGQACRTCSSHNGETQTQCVVAGDIFCQEEEVFVAPPPTDPNGPAAPPEVQVCTVCRDSATGDEVYRDQDCAGASGGVACEPATAVDGTQCEICFDDATNQPVFSTCGGTTDMCVEAFDVPLGGDGGQDLFLPQDPNVDQPPVPAIVDCRFCESPANVFPPEDGGSCVLQAPTCDATNGAPCFADVRTTLAFDLTHCADPWGASDGLDGMVRAAAWALREHQVVAFRVTHELPSMNDTTTCDACNCARGDRFLWEVSVDAANALLQLGLGFYETQIAPVPGTQP